VDGLPLIGMLPDLPVAAACGYGRLGLAYALVGARWAAEALATGRDPTPAPFRADRPLPRAD
jgi:glycine/D-amino acid oxidase-like deaminating enzyme